MKGKLWYIEVFEKNKESYFMILAECDEVKREVLLEWVYLHHL